MTWRGKGDNSGRGAAAFMGLGVIGAILLLLLAFAGATGLPDAPARWHGAAIQSHSVPGVEGAAHAHPALGGCSAAIGCAPVQGMTAGPVALVLPALPQRRGFGARRMVRSRPVDPDIRPPIG